MENLWLDTSLGEPLTMDEFPASTQISAISAQQSESHCGTFTMNYPGHQGSGWSISTSVYNTPDVLRAPQPSPALRYNHYTLRVLQHPEHGKTAVGKEKDRKPLDPPPLVELVVERGPDSLTYLQSPYTMVLAYLESTKDAGEKDSKTIGGYLTGTTASSLHRVKNMENKDIAAFVFPDLAVKNEGRFRLRFVLMVMEEANGSSEVGTWLTITECFSNDFVVHNTRNFPGMAESTSLTRMFADQGIRLRLRKDSRQLTTKKQNSSTAFRLAGKRGRDPSENPTNEEDVPSTAQRRSITSPDRPYFDAQAFNEGSDPKRQRTTSAGQNAYSIRHNIPASMPFQYPAMTSLPSHHGAFLTSSEAESPIYAPSYQNRDMFSSSIAPIGLPRSGSNRLDSQLGPYHGDVFASSTTQSSANPYQYQNTPHDASATIQHSSQGPIGYYQTGEGHLPALSRALNPASAHVNTSPQGNHQTINTPVSSTGSPIEGSGYTHVAPQFGSSYMGHHAGSFDHGTLRTHGMSTPVTGNLPADPLQGSFMQDQLLPISNHLDFKATQGG